MFNLCIIIDLVMALDNYWSHDKTSLKVLNLCLKSDCVAYLQIEIVQGVKSVVMHDATEPLTRQ